MDTGEGSTQATTEAVSTEVRFIDPITDRTTVVHLTITPLGDFMVGDRITTPPVTDPIDVGDNTFTSDTRSRTRRASQLIGSFFSNGQ